MDKTQERLSTGKKVNSAIDNASSYYQARSLTNRAADLDSLLDSMGQGIQTIKAANEGIEAITSYVDQLKSVATSAFALDPTQASYTTELGKYQEQYNAILKEIATLAKDASYQGVNLLKGNTLTVMFNETRTHQLDVVGQDVIAEMTKTDPNGFAWKIENNEEVGNVSWAAVPGTHVEVKYYEMTAAGTQPTKTEEVLAGDFYEFDTAKKEWKESTAYNAGTTYYTKAATLTEDPVYLAAAADNKYSGTSVTIGGATKAIWADSYSEAIYAEDGTEVGKTSAMAVNDSLDAIAKVNTYLRSYATELGNNFTIIETRQDFTEALVDVLETGSDNLVLADMNEESANYLALQTRQQLAINSLSLASQSAQSVLKLF
jgi:flagellin-like hook-associated protein FlgL